MRSKRRSRVACAALGVAAALALAACSSSGGGSGSGSGSSSGPIVIGATNPLSGIAAAAGEVGLGAKAYYAYVNAHGGVNGRKIQFDLLDDANDPSQTVQMTKQLVEQDHVLATVGSLGTATNLAVRQYLNQNKVPQLYIIGGYDDFSTQYKQYPYTMAWEVPYGHDGQIYANYIIQHSPNATVAVLYQGDATGEGYLDGFEQGLQGQSGVKIIDKQSYSPTATSVSSQIANLKASHAQILVIFAVPGFTPMGLEAAYSQGWHPTIYVDPSSNSSADMLAVQKQTGSASSVDGVYSLTFYKDPTEPSLVNDPGITLFKQIMAQYCKGCNAQDVYYLKGMSAAWSFVHAAMGIKGAITSASILNAVQHLDQTNNPFLLNGVKVQTSPTDYAPIEQASIIQFNNGTFDLEGSLINAAAG